MSKIKILFAVIVTMCLSSCGRSIIVWNGADVVVFGLLAICVLVLLGALGIERIKRRFKK